MTQPDRPGDEDERIPFVLDLASALHQAGHATHRLEEGLEATATSLGIAGQYFVTPTSIFASFGTGTAQQTFMIRTAPKPPDLGRLARVTAIARDVVRSRLSLRQGREALAALASRPGPGAAAVILAHGLASGGAARFLGGGWAEMGMAASAGIATGLLAVVVMRWLPNLSRVYELAASIVCAFAMAALGAAVGGYSVAITTLAGVIVLLPGLTLTTAIAELATSHLTAGTTRLAAAFMTFIAMGFGVAFGGRLATMVTGPAPVVVPSPTPPIVNWLALVATALAFSILLRADRRDLGWIVAAGAFAFVATRLGGMVLGPELGVFVGALAVGIGSNLFNRLTERPAAVTLVPGLLILVPGSIGFRSISALLESQVVTGIDTAFSMLLTAVSLVAGLLTAAAIYPERSLG